MHMFFKRKLVAIDCSFSSSARSSTAHKQPGSMALTAVSKQLLAHLLNIFPLITNLPDPPKSGTLNKSSAVYVGGGKKRPSALDWLQSRLGKQPGSISSVNGANRNWTETSFLREMRGPGCDVHAPISLRRRPSMPASHASGEFPKSARNELSRMWQRRTLNV